MQHNYLARLFKVIVCFLILAMSACHRGPRYLPEAQIPKMPCRVTGACDATMIQYLRYFHKRGVKIITMGQNYLVSIPASALFADQSPRLHWGSYGLLNDVAGFLKQFRKIAIHVSSYSSPYVSHKREHALTTARSRVVGEYLWTRGIDSRFIFTEGFGSDKPIVRTMVGGDKSPNARIEITFRDAVA